MRINRVMPGGMGVLVPLMLAGCGGGEAPPPTVLASPVAGFTVSPSAAAPRQTLSFVDTSSGSPTTWHWEFGDGSTSTLQNPTHAYAATGTFQVRLTCTNGAGSSTATRSVPVAVAQTWRFAMVGDTHVSATQKDIPTEIVSAMLADTPTLVLVAGDIVEGGTAASGTTLARQLDTFRTVFAPLTTAGIPVYPIRGNHENDAADNLTAWQTTFSGTAALPANGPAAETGLTYAVTQHNALFLGLDNYVSLHHVNQPWLQAQLNANTRPHVFVFGHEPAFKVFHTDCLDDDATARNTFWQSLARGGARVYLCGHDHFFDVARLDDGDGNTTNDLYQFVVGTGGGTFASSYAYGGVNAPYTPVGITHQANHGYLLAEISGTGSQDLGVTLTWKQRTEGANGAVSYVPAYSFSYLAASRDTPRSYAIVDTGETDCYGDTATVIPAPAPDQPFYGQDPQVTGLQPAYRDNGDGTTTDLNTGLMWVKARGSKVSWAEAVAGAASCTTGGYKDWRMPTLKELYSLILYTGAQGTSLTSSTGYVPFLDTKAFDFQFGPGTSTTTGNRIIDCQDWSGTAYVSTTMGGSATAFGVNFADGRIKGYPSGTVGGTLNTNYVRYVRGNPTYGQNAFHDNGDGTVSDSATGLMWSQADSGVAMDWQTALAWVQARNRANHLGHSDWRMPNVKELQSLVDYTRAPDAPAADHRGPAIDPVFACTSIQNEGGVLDYPTYWSGTNFKDGTPEGVAAAYVCFGRALGYMKLNGATTYQLLDVHGAGAQRSDPKRGSVTDYPLGTDASGKTVYGRGPQGDVVRIQHMVRLVRNLS